MDVNTNLTVKRPKRVRETNDYAAFVRRTIRAYSRRVAQGDVDALPEMLAIMAEFDQAIRESVKALHDGKETKPYSWAEIGQRVGLTRQACQQRWGR